MNQHNLLVALIIGLLPAGQLTAQVGTNKDGTTGYIHRAAGNPYLPLWEHVPDAEPRVFEDPENPGHYRIYVVGSHDVLRSHYCGADNRMWSAPVEDLTAWRDEGPLYTYKHGNTWDIMFAPDLVEVKGKDGRKKYYLYPNCRGAGREATVCVSNRPDGPFTPVNLTAGYKQTAESCMGFDPAVYVEQVNDPKAIGYDVGWRAWGYWGFRRSTAAELDAKTMFSVKPGTKAIENFLPSGDGYGKLYDNNVTDYPCIYNGEDPLKFSFYEASSIRKVGNKYVMIYSGFSGPEYGLPSSNSTLRYAYGDSPMGPWKSGGILVDSRGPELDVNGRSLQKSNGNHNTHGSIQQINGQWYVFYHRPPRDFGYARQAMVAPIKVITDQKSVTEGGSVIITGYDPYRKECIWTAKDSHGHEYTGAEVTSEGFHIFGLDPYNFYPAGIACYLSDPSEQQDNWDIWCNNAPITNVKSGDVIGYKYFGFGGLSKDTLGLKTFRGSLKGENTTLNIWVKPLSPSHCVIEAWLDGPSKKGQWHGNMIGKATIPIDNNTLEPIKLSIDVAQYVEGLKGKHAIYLVAKSNDKTPLFNLLGLGFSSRDKIINYPSEPELSIYANGKKIELPSEPTPMNETNGYTGYDVYESTCFYTGKLPKVSASTNDSCVKISVTQASEQNNMAIIKADWQGLVKTYKIKFASQHN